MSSLLSSSMAKPPEGEQSNAHVFPTVPGAGRGKWSAPLWAGRGPRPRPHAPTPHGSGVSVDPGAGHSRPGPTSSSHVARTPQHLQTPSLWVVGRSLGTGDTQPRACAGSECCAPTWSPRLGGRVQHGGAGPGVHTGCQEWRWQGHLPLGNPQERPTPGLLGHLYLSSLATWWPQGRPSYRALKAPETGDQREA